jgi:hypothetical protein
MGRHSLKMVAAPLPLPSNLMRVVRRTHVHLGSAIAAKTHWNRQPRLYL